MLVKALKLQDVKNALRPEPLLAEELGEFFEDTADARDQRMDRRFAVASYLDTPTDVKVLLFGHAGCGKSTELAKLVDEHKGEFTFVSFSLQKEAQLTHASIESLLVLIVEALIKGADEHQLELAEATVKEFFDWFSETLGITEEDLKASLSFGAGFSAKSTYVGKLFGLLGYIKSDIKAGAQILRRSTAKEEKRLASLSLRCNSIINEIALALKAAKKPDLVLVIEDLDKLSLETATDILIENPGPLAGLACKCVLTAPIWLLCNPRSSDLDPYFERVTLPMIKVSERDGAPCVRGRETITQILARRMDLDALIDGGAGGEALALAIEKTGGVLRHLFDVLERAAMTANYAVQKHGRAEHFVKKEDIRYGLDQLRSDLVRRLGTFGLPEAYQGEGTSPDKMYERLESLLASPRRLDSTLLNLLLIQAHAVIEYNGVGWHAPHPLIAEHLQSRKS